jgi:hypothetical protein
MKAFVSCIGFLIFSHTGLLYGGSIKGGSVEDLAPGTLFVFNQKIELPGGRKEILFQAQDFIFDRKYLNPKLSYCSLAINPKLPNTPNPIEIGVSLELLVAKNSPWGRFVDVGQDPKNPKIFKMAYLAFPVVQFIFKKNLITERPLTCFPSVQPDLQTFNFEVPMAWITDFLPHQKEYNDALTEVAQKSISQMGFLMTEEVKEILNGIIRISDH